MAKKAKTMFKVTNFRILKPAGDMTWKELGQLLRDARYRTFRMANLALSEAYLNFYLLKKGDLKEYKNVKIGQIAKRLRDMLIEEGVDEEVQNRFSPKVALPAYVYSALDQFKLRGLTSKSNWKKVLRGQASLPTFRLNMSVPIRCDKPEHRRLEKTENGNVEVDLMICRKPYPRVVLETLKLDGSSKAILDRLLENEDNSPGNYRQRCFEVKQNPRSNDWWLYVTYEMPVDKDKKLDPKVIVGVDLGFSVPLYVAINNGHARLGRRHFQALGKRIHNLQNQVLARRRSIQRGGQVNLSHSTSRSGHGRKRKLQPTKKLQQKINSAYSTLNHQLSSSVIDFANNHKAGTIQIEDLETLKEQLTGTYIGRQWRYYQLQQFIEYKAKENSITVKKINPKYTSRRCSMCGHIHADFDRTFRDRSSNKGFVTKFICPECNFEADPDYNAAKNISTLDIENKIKLQCKKQKIDY